MKQKLHFPQLLFVVVIITTIYLFVRAEFQATGVGFTPEMYEFIKVLGIVMLLAFFWFVLMHQIVHLLTEIVRFILLALITVFLFIVTVLFLVPQFLN